MTNAERIIAALRNTPGFDDDELSSITGIRPRQQVNQICRKLEAGGVVSRVKSADSKIVNVLVDGAPHIGERDSVKAPRAIEPFRLAPVPSSSAPAYEVANPHQTLFVICCSGSKNSGSSTSDGTSILDSLTESTANDLRGARSAVASRAELDESTRMPAWRRYGGGFYGAAEASIGRAIAENLHIAIISGGYGLLLPSESIGMYQRVFRCSEWPSGLLQRVFGEYARCQKLTSLRGFVPSSTDYGKLLRRVPWKESGVTDAWMFSAERVRGALVKNPRALGEAFKTLMRGELKSDWRSSDGLRIEAIELR
jgi:hypothetical protein